MKFSKIDPSTTIAEPSQLVTSRPWPSTIPNLADGGYFSDDGGVTWVHRTIDEALAVARRRQAAP